jgi:outer membrane lipoprotein SlyB
MATTRQTLAAAVVAALPLISVVMPAPAYAQDHPRAARLAPRIESFGVDEVRRLEPGTQLNFELVGTPGGVATLRIDGATRNLTLTETSPGTYQGTYTIRDHDRLNPGSSVTANLRVNDMVTTRLLGEAIMRGPGDRDGRRDGDRGGDRSQVTSGMPRVDRFDVRGSDDLGPGNELKFTVSGTPGAKVEVQIAGTRSGFFLPETRPGEYSGLYTIRRDDRITPDAPVTATIRANGRATTATLAQPLIAGGNGQGIRPGRDGGPGPGDRRAGDGVQSVARYCTNCATVDAINVVQGNGSTALGTAGGAVVGGLLGNQIGSGGGRTAATVAGALGGALAGREIQRNANSGQRYEVVVRYSNGATQTVSYDNEPGFRVGDQVKVNDGVLTRD